MSQHFFTWTTVFELFLFFSSYESTDASYAELITQAINSSPDQRLTLSQIYDWMVQNVLYFKDKGESNSSAGWKVSNVIELSEEEKREREREVRLVSSR